MVIESYYLKTKLKLRPLTTEMNILQIYTLIQWYGYAIRMNVSRMNE